LQDQWRGGQPSTVEHRKDDGVEVTASKARDDSDARWLVRDVQGVGDRTTEQWRLRHILEEGAEHMNLLSMRWRRHRANRFVTLRAMCRADRPGI
jgi:hypothetical protein